MPSEQVKHPTHYNWLPGVECIQVVQHFNFNLGNAIKYVWRAGRKDSSSTLVDLKKAREYLDFEIARLEPESIPQKYVPCCIVCRLPVDPNGPRVITMHGVYHGPCRTDRDRVV